MAPVKAGTLALLFVAATVVCFVALGLVRLKKARDGAERVSCVRQLREIRELAAKEARKKGVPMGGGFAFLKELDDSRGIPLFLCPASRPDAVEVDAAGRFDVSPEGSSYEMVSWKVPLDVSDAILAFDRSPVHGGGRNVVFTDGSLQFMEEPIFQERLKADGLRLAPKEN